MSNLLECHNICKTYREGSLDTHVLKGVSFELKKRGVGVDHWLVWFR